MQAQRINTSKETATTSIVQKFTTTSKLVVLLILLIIIASAGIIYVIVNSHKNEPTQRGPILFGNNYNPDTLPNLGNGHLVVDRMHWGASELAKDLTIPLKHPTPYVMITHVNTKSLPCLSIYKCSIKMRSLQDAAISENKLPDINGNFYVGHDGNIYVGRGWDYANTYANNTLSVTFLGNYDRNMTSPKQIEATQYLLAYGLTNQYLELDYKLVAQNQTRPMISPGENIFKYIKKWPHFYPCGMNGNPKCGNELGLPEVWEARM